MFYGRNAKRKDNELVVKIDKCGNERAEREGMRKRPFQRRNTNSSQEVIHKKDTYISKVNFGRCVKYK